jgi:hypothetical protein
MRILFIFCLFFAYLRPITAQTRNIIKGTGIGYTNGSPSYTVRTAYDGENAVDITTGARWYWNRTTSQWTTDYERIMLLAGTSAPAFTPGYGQPKLVLNDANVLYRNVSGSTWATVGGGGGSGTVTSVGLTMPSILNVTGSPITTSGTFGVTLAAQSANTIFAGPTSGGATTPAFRALVDADLPVVPISKIANGTANQILGSNASGTALEHKTLVAGTNVTITHAANSVTIAATGGGGYSGTASQTLRHDGTAFVASSNLLNTGTAVGIGISPATTLHVNGATRSDGNLISRGVGSTGSTAAALLRLWNTTATTGVTWDVVSENDGSLDYYANGGPPVATMEATGTIKPTHIGYLGSAPTITLGTGAGTGATATVTGGDNAFLITITTGTSPAAGPADVFTITFATPYVNTPTIVFIPDNQNASIADGRLFFFSKSNSAFTVRNRTTAMTASVNYTYAVMVIGN